MPLSRYAKAMVAYLGFAVPIPNVLMLAGSFIVAGLVIGCIETSQHASVVALLLPICVGQPSDCLRR